MAPPDENDEFKSGNVASYATVILALAILGVLLTGFTLETGKMSVDVPEQGVKVVLVNKEGAACTCSGVYAPVCGRDGKTYFNDCFAKCENVAVARQGACDQAVVISSCGPAGSPGVVFGLPGAGGNGIPGSPGEPGQPGTGANDGVPGGVDVNVPPGVECYTVTVCTAPNETAVCEQPEPEPTPDPGGNDVCSQTGEGCGFYSPPGSNGSYAISAYRSCCDTAAVCDTGYPANGWSGTCSPSGGTTEQCVPEGGRCSAFYDTGMNQYVYPSPSNCCENTYCNANTGYCAPSTTTTSNTTPGTAYSCMDPDVGPDAMYIATNASRYVNGNFYNTMADECWNSTAVFETSCQENNQSYWRDDISCPAGFLCLNAACVPQQCEETDNGFEWNVQGTATGSPDAGYPRSNYTDYCDTGLGKLVEYGCEATGYVAMQEKICEYGCMGGACEDAPSCTDSDGGQNYDVQGTITGPMGTGQSPTSQTDSCQAGSTTLLNEYYCSPGGIIFVDQHTCPYGCTNGVCNPSSYTCSDTDGGQVYTTTGTVSGTVAGSPYSYTDYCPQGNWSYSLTEYYCTTAGTYTSVIFGCSPGTYCIDGRCATP